MTIQQCFVVVLGDLGRSPRMCNHAASLSEDFKAKVHLFGYSGSNLSQKLQNNPNVQVHHVPPFPDFLNKCLPRLVAYGMKVAWQYTILLSILLWTALCSGFPNYLFLQNPPCIPALIVCKHFCRFFSCGKVKLVIDWHNYGYTILALAHNDNENHPIVKLAKYVEKSYGPGADGHLCVSNAMKNDLEQKWNIKVFNLILGVIL